MSQITVHSRTCKTNNLATATITEKQLYCQWQHNLHSRSRPCFIPVRFAACPAAAGGAPAVSCQGQRPGGAAERQARCEAAECDWLRPTPPHCRAGSLPFCSAGFVKKMEKKAHQSATSGQQAWPLSGFRILLSKTTQYPQSFIHSNGHSDTELRTQNFSFTVVFVLLHFRLTLKNFQIWCFPTPFCSMYDLIETKVLSYSSGNQRAWNVCLMCNTALTLAKHSSQNQKTKLDRIRKPHQYRIREPSQYRIRKLSQYRIREPSQTELGNPANI